jgi:hypothetical protein
MALGFLGVASLPVLPYVLAIAAIVALAVCAIFAITAIVKWRNAKKKSAEKEQWLMREESFVPLGQDKEKSAPEPTSRLRKALNFLSSVSASEKAMGLIMATVAIVTSAICTFGVSLIIVGACSLVLACFIGFKHKESQLKSQKEAILNQLQRKKVEQKKVLIEAEVQKLSLSREQREQICVDVRPSSSGAHSEQPSSDPVPVAMEKALRNHVPYPDYVTRRFTPEERTKVEAWVEKRRTPRQLPCL